MEIKVNKSFAFQIETYHFNQWKEELFSHIDNDDFHTGIFPGKNMESLAFGMMEFHTNIQKHKKTIPEIELLDSYRLFFDQYPLSFQSLNNAYKLANENVRAVIRQHKNWKSDAQLILEAIAEAQ